MASYPTEKSVAVLFSPRKDELTAILPLGHLPSAEAEDDRLVAWSYFGALAGATSRGPGRLGRGQRRVDRILAVSHRAAIGTGVIVCWKTASVDAEFRD